MLKLLVFLALLSFTDGMTRSVEADTQQSMNPQCRAISCTPVQFLSGGSWFSLLVPLSPVQPQAIAAGSFRHIFFFKAGNQLYVFSSSAPRVPSTWAGYAQSRHPWECRPRIGTINRKRSVLSVVILSVTIERSAGMRPGDGDLQRATSQTGFPCTLLMAAGATRRHLQLCCFIFDSVLSVLVLLMAMELRADGWPGQPRTSVSCNASHLLATPYQVILEKYHGVLCARAKKSACQVTQVTLHKKYFRYNDVLRFFLDVEAITSPSCYVFCVLLFFERSHAQKITR